MIVQFKTLAGLSQYAGRLAKATGIRRAVVEWALVNGKLRVTHTLADDTAALVAAANDLNDQFSAYTAAVDDYHKQLSV